MWEVLFDSKFEEVKMVLLPSTRANSKSTSTPRRRSVEERRSSTSAGFVRSERDGVSLRILPTRFSSRIILLLTLPEIPAYLPLCSQLLVRALRCQDRSIPHPIKRISSALHPLSYVIVPIQNHLEYR